MGPLSGYLLLGQALLEGKQECSGAWNFGPSNEGHKNVIDVVKEFQKYWTNIDYQIKTDEKNPHEANFLKLDCSKAYSKLKWELIWKSPMIFKRTAQWYKGYYETEEVRSEEELNEYLTDAKQKQILWALQ